MNEEQVRLEMKITELERTVSELGDVLYQQQKLLDRLDGEVKRLESRLDAPVVGLPPTDERPPHY